LILKLASVPWPMPTQHVSQGTSDTHLTWQWHLVLSLRHIFLLFWQFCSSTCSSSPNHNIYIITFLDTYTVLKRPQKKARLHSMCTMYICYEKKETLNWVNWQAVHAHICKWLQRHISNVAQWVMQWLTYHDWQRAVEVEALQTA